ncbi:hypothetical protein BDFB_005531 [Asbolus verrucosus]|uniref:Uncharacterized protein n=1 Tax=Asbolus verrucosus TaxID=1661398 RepID=A0A482W3K3_ASBVE|nr:hypothetical protein BDFB_005531 [Asbolus verrucosus]
MTHFTHCALLTKDTVRNIDVSLQQACDAGESAIVELMDVLEENILQLCKAYQDCLKKQIEIIRDASELGPLSSKWDDLPEYRSLSVELSQELSNFTAVVNTIGQMIRNETIKHITQQKKCMNLIAGKHKELEAILKKQTEEIKKLESKILDVKRESIVKAR